LWESQTHNLMANTLFLQQSYPFDNPNPNYARATGGAVFSHYSQTASGTLTATEADTLVKGGVSAAIADAKLFLAMTQISLLSLLTVL